MSEYQYYEFLAIDRPLSEKELDAVRSTSSRASITPNSFTNVYHWGSFKGDPLNLMRRYYDAQVYMANWMSATFMLKVPKNAIPEKMTRAVSEKYILDFDETAEHWIITWNLSDSENDDRFGMEDGTGWMVRLIPIRDELMRGDYRSLYIGWLAAVSQGAVDDEAEEPFLPAGLGTLTAAQQALADFIDVDVDLLAGAGMGTPSLKANPKILPDMDEWLDSVPPQEIRALLKQVLEGRGQQAERALKNRFSSWQRERTPSASENPCRFVEELLANAEKAEALRLEKQKTKERKAGEEKNRQRNAALEKLAKDFPTAWKKVNKTVETASGRAYDLAAVLLTDLSDAYKAHRSTAEFNIEMKRFMDNHGRRKALITRLEKAKIWKP